MTKHLTLLLFIGLTWGQDTTSVSPNDRNVADKLIQSFRSDMGKFYTMTYYGKFIGQKKSKVYFKPTDDIPLKLLPLNEIKELKQDNKVLIKNGKWKIEPKNFISLEELNTEKLSSLERAMNDANKWILYPPTAFLMFGAMMLGSKEEPWEYLPATLGISAASLTIPYLLFKELTWEKTEDFNSKDKKLYKKIYLKEFQKRKLTNIIYSSLITGVLGPLLYISAVESGLK